MRPWLVVLARRPVVPAPQAGHALDQPRPVAQRPSDPGRERIAVGRVTQGRLGFHGSNMGPMCLRNWALADCALRDSGAAIVAATTYFYDADSLICSDFREG